MPTRYPALDGLRGFAIALVLMFHFVDLHWRFHSPILIGLQLITMSGWAGVDLFFVLSGFLITGILYDSLGSSNYFATFYVRRSIRIFPLYFVLVFGYIIAVPMMFDANVPSRIAFEHAVPFVLTYTANFARAIGGLSAVPLHIGPTWSLAIEEQFYLVWPLAMLLIPKARLKAFCLAVSGIALGLRVVAVLFAGHLWAAAMMPCRADTLAIGGWVAIALRDGSLERFTALSRDVGLWCAVALIALVVIGLSGPEGIEGASVPMLTIGYSLIAFLFGAALVDAVTLRPSIWTTIGLWRPLRWLSRYSYGIYLLQGPVRLVFEGHKFTADRLVAAGWSPLAATAAFAAVVIPVAIAAAVISWRVLEQPINALKDRFPYSKSRETAARCGVERVAMHDLT